MGTITIVSFIYEYSHYMCCDNAYACTYCQVRLAISCITIVYHVCTVHVLSELLLDISCIIIASCFKCHH